MKKQKVTERIIAKADLSSEEAKVARVYFDVPTAGPRTKRWVGALSDKKRVQFLSSAQEKIQQTLRTQRVGN